MSRPPRRYFAGNTLGQAVMAAASHYQLAPEELDYRRLAKRHGFVKHLRNVVIEVDPGHPRREGGVPAAAPAAPSGPPRAPEAPSRAPRRGPRSGAGRRAEGAPAGGHERDRPAGPPSPELIAAAREGAGRLAALAGLAVEVTARGAADAIEVDLGGEDAAVLADPESELFVAFEVLLPRLLRGGAGTQYPCRLDSGGRRAAQAERLRDEARAAAVRVREAGEPFVFPPLAPAERRIIHLALADEPGVRTESQGEGWRKRVAVLAAAASPERDS